MGSWQGTFWTCSARPFMPRLMSVRPTASQTRTPREPESSPLQHVEHAPDACRSTPLPTRTRYRRPTSISISSARWPARGSACCSGVTVTGISWSPPARPVPAFAIALAPTEHLVRVHIVAPGNHRDRRARRKRRRNDLPLQRLRPRAVPPPPAELVPITDFVDTSRSHNTRITSLSAQCCD